MFLKTYRRILATPFRYQCRWLVTEAESEVTPPKEPKKRRKRVEATKIGEKRVTKEMAAYFDAFNMTPMLQILPQTALTRKIKAPEGFYIAHEESAEKIAQVLVKDLDKDQTLVEANPGLGLLTQRLIERTSNNLMLYEPAKMHHSHLQASFLESPMNLNLIVQLPGHHWSEQGQIGYNQRRRSINALATGVYRQT